MTDSRSGPAGRWGGDPSWGGLDEQILDDSEYPEGEAGDAAEHERDLVDRRREMDGRLHGTDDPDNRPDPAPNEVRPAQPEAGAPGPTPDADAGPTPGARTASASGTALSAPVRLDPELAAVVLDTEDDGGLDEGALPDDDPDGDPDDDADDGSDGVDAAGDQADEEVAASLAGETGPPGAAVDVIAELARLTRADPELAERFAEITAELVDRWPEARVDPTLSRIRLLCELLGDPQASVPAIHLTGTNGKTSTARMTETLLRGLGLRTGTYTSPHLQDVRERILLDGRPIGIRRFVEVFDEVEPYLALVDSRSENPVSFFEALTALGFAAFADAPVDVAVLEVGLGGTWDATNVADARVAVLTRVAVDHAHLLGDTPAQIAIEKVGVIKPGAIVVSARQDDDVLAVIEARVAEVGATLRLAGRDFDVESRQVAVGGQLLTLRGSAATYPDVFLPLHGAHQAENAACALVAAEAFFGGGRRPLRSAAVTEAFAQVSSPGRLELVARAPAVVLDAAHNPAGARAIARTLRESFGFDRVVGVLGVMADKDVAGVLAALGGVLDEVVLSQNATTRAMPAHDLARLAADVWPADRVHVEADLATAITLGRRLADAPRAQAAPEVADRSAPESGVGAGPVGVLVSGSVVTVGEARTILRRALPGQH